MCKDGKSYWGRVTVSNNVFLPKLLTSKISTICTTLMSSPWVTPGSIQSLIAPAPLCLAVAEFGSVITVGVEALLFLVMAHQSNSMVSTVTPSLWILSGWRVFLAVMTSRLLSTAFLNRISSMKWIISSSFKSLHFFNMDVYNDTFKRSRKLINS